MGAWGNALAKQGKLEEAITVYQKSLTEHRRVVVVGGGGVCFVGWRVGGVSGGKRAGHNQLP